jgi:hypothetical protein
MCHWRHSLRPTQRVVEMREPEAGQAASRRRLATLFQSMLHQAFAGQRYIPYILDDLEATKTG